MKLFSVKGLVLITALLFFAQSYFPKPSVQSKLSYIAPPIEIKYLNAGFSPQVSDGFWLRALQDLDYCNQKINETDCVGKSWVFQVINLVVELDNKFLEAYYYGALALTIVISDYEGASIIFNKGTSQFQNEWTLLYAAGYHSLFVEKNKIKASELYLRAVNSGAPDWVRLLAGRLAAEGGDKIGAQEILQQLIERESDSIWIKKLKDKIQDVNR